MSSGMLAPTSSTFIGSKSDDSHGRGLMLESKMADKECIYLTADNAGCRRIGDRVILTGKVIDVFKNRNQEDMVLIEVKKDHSLAFHN
jgi:hypothetical protein